MRGIVLADRRGSRLHPITLSTSKQLLPVYGRPTIDYPLSMLMVAGFRGILVIITPVDASAFHRLLGDGAKFGISIAYAVQPVADGLAPAFVIGGDHIGIESVVLVLGDNIFHGTYSDLEKPRTIEPCQDLQVGVPEDDELRQQGELLSTSGYGVRLLIVLAGSGGAR